MGKAKEAFRRKKGRKRAKFYEVMVEG